MITLTLVRPFTKEDLDYPNSDRFMNDPLPMIVTNYPDNKYGAVSIPNRAQMKVVMDAVENGLMSSVLTVVLAKDGRQVIGLKYENEQPEPDKGVIK